MATRLRSAGPRRLLLRRDFRAAKRLEKTPVAGRLVFGLLMMVLIGTLLLRLPGMTTRPITWMEAAFTATSAVTVTGLSILTTSTDFTFRGQVVLLLLIQAGGVGFMALVALAMIILRRRITYQDRIALVNAMGLDKQRAIMRFFGLSLAVMVTVEGLGALLLYVWWTWGGIVTTGPVWFYALFHAVSAFCNAGFDLFAGLAAYPAGLPTDGFTLLLLGLLILLGGLGLPIYMELIYERKRRRGRLSLNARVTLVSALILFVVGWAALFAVEMGREGALTEAGFFHSLTQSAFQSISARTAGFPGFAGFTDMRQASRLLILTLMFIGTAPASMGGGITTGTFAVLVLAISSYSLGHRNVRVGKRTLPQAVILRAAVVLVLSLNVALVATWLLLATHPFTLDTALFEVMSALSTCGLSLGITGQLNIFGRLLIMAVMFWGRLGAVTVMIALVQRHQHTSAIDFPEESVLVG